MISFSHRHCLMQEEPQAKDPRWNDTVTAAPSETCISTVEQLEPLLRNISFYDDLRLHKGRGLNRTHLWQLVTRNSGIGRVRTFSPRRQPPISATCVVQALMRTFGIFQRLSPAPIVFRLADRAGQHVSGLPSQSACSDPQQHPLQPLARPIGAAPP